MEALEWRFKKHGLYPVGFEQIFAGCSIMTLCIIRLSQEEPPSHSTLPVVT